MRDVTSHPPLVGLAGRIGTEARKGSHPGPLSFYALWPLYEMFGASAWALVAATAALQTIAAATAIWIGRRRGGVVLAFGVFVAVLVLMAYLGPSVLIQPWNPYLPTMWWVVFVLAVWAVSCGDVVCLPVAAFAGAFCMQTHISYTVLVVVGSAYAAVWAVVLAFRQTDAARTRAVRWSAAAGATFAAAWVLPVYQQLSARDGNLGIVVDYFTHPPTPTIGLHRGLDLMLVHLNPWTCFGSRLSVTPTASIFTGNLTGSTVPGALLVLVWAAAFVIAVRLRHAALLRLHALTAVLLVAGTVSMSRIFGPAYGYLVLWSAPLCLLLLGTAVGTLVVAASRRAPVGRDAAAMRPVAIVLAVSMTAALALKFIEASVNLDLGLGEQSNAVATKLVTPTRDALRRGIAAAGGRHGRYVVAPLDAFGNYVFALVDELDRDGFRVGVLPTFGAYVGSHRTLTAQAATGAVYLAAGDEIRKWRSHPEATEVAYVDVRTPAQRRRWERLRQRAAVDLRAAGLDHLVPLLGVSPYGVLNDRAIPARVRPIVSEMARIGLPRAVFVTPASRLFPIIYGTR